jgi:hypothetical protein
MSIQERKVACAERTKEHIFSVEFLHQAHGRETAVASNCAKDEAFLGLFSAVVFPYNEDNKDATARNMVMNTDQ